MATEVTAGDVLRRVAPLVGAALAACIAIGVAVGRAIDNATRSIGH